MSASVRAVDLTTGTVFSARVLEHRPEETFKSSEGPPEYPSEYDVLNEAYALVVRDVHRMFLPWTEPRELVFFNDKKCGLKNAHQAMKNSNFERALEISLRNVEVCEADPRTKEKLLGQAYYNVGMSHLILGQPDEALEALHRSAELRPGGIVEEAIADTEQARALLFAKHQGDEDAAFEIQQREAEAATARANMLTNADIVTMAQQNLPEVLIIAKIESSTVDFDVSTSALVELNEAGVSPNVIMTMMSAGQ